MKITIEKDDLVLIPESSGDCFRLGQISRNVPSCTQVYINDIGGGIAEFQKLLIHKNTVLGNLCGDEK